METLERHGGKRHTLKVKPGPLKAQCAPPPLARHSPHLQLAPTMASPRDPADRDASFRELERRALDDLPDEDRRVDVVRALRPTERARKSHAGGYIDKHQRVPAFEGSDDQPYTWTWTDHPRQPRVRGVPGQHPRAATGAGIMDHTESRDVASGATG
jgi:hypothetical protein